MVTICETCDGKRFTDEVLEHRLRGKSISDVYEMSGRGRGRVLHRAGDRQDPARGSTMWASAI